MLQWVCLLIQDSLMYHRLFLNSLYQVNITNLKAGVIGIHTFITAGQDRFICLNFAIYK